MNIEMSDHIWNQVLKGIKSGSLNVTLELTLHEAAHERLHPPSPPHPPILHPSLAGGRWRRPPLLPAAPRSWTAFSFFERDSFPSDSVASSGLFLDSHPHLRLVWAPSSAQLLSAVIVERCTLKMLWKCDSDGNITHGNVETRTV